MVGTLVGNVNDASSILPKASRDERLQRDRSGTAYDQRGGDGNPFVNRNVGTRIMGTDARISLKGFPDRYGLPAWWPSEGTQTRQPPKDQV